MKTGVAFVHDDISLLTPRDRLSGEWVGGRQAGRLMTDAAIPLANMSVADAISRDRRDWGRPFSVAGDGSQHEFPRSSFDIPRFSFFSRCFVDFVSMGE